MKIKREREIRESHRKKRENRRERNLGIEK
jgi:hypothetical protein